VDFKSQEKSLIEPGYFGSSKDNILIIKNFVESEDLKTIQNFLPTINEWMDAGENKYAEDGTCTYDASYWQNRQCSGEILSRINLDIYNLIDKYILKMKWCLEDKFKVNLSVRPPVIIRWFPGLEQKPHADKQLNDGSPNPFPTYDINSLLYYNDEFTGGELYYPQHDLVIKPEPGLAIAHPGDINYLHGVKMVTKGERYTTPSFYTITKLL
jgi:predicted 2-oxoglutarate/Fe(II)-dependent dioxygenase YbiX